MNTPHYSDEEREGMLKTVEGLVEQQAELIPAPSPQQKPIGKGHHCFAIGCKEPPKEAGHLMCGKHWVLVPSDVKRLMWSEVKKSQKEGRKTPTPRWVEAAKIAIVAVFKVESHSGVQRAEKEKTGDDQDAGRSPPAAAD